MPSHAACPLLEGLETAWTQVPEAATIVPGGGAKTRRPVHTVNRPPLQRDAAHEPRAQNRTPPVRIKVFPPPISPRASTNGVSLLPFNLNVVPPSRFSPALVSEALTRSEERRVGKECRSR